MCVTLPNFIKIGQTAADIWQFTGFFRMVAVRCVGFFGTTHDDQLVVSIVVQNLVETDAVVLII